MVLQEEERLQDEAELCASFGAIVHHYNQELIRLRKMEREIERDNIQTDFTPAEKKIFHVASYRNHTLGLLAGGLTMATLFGLSRFRNRNSAVSVERLTNTARNKSYRDVDGGGMNQPQKSVSVSQEGPATEDSLGSVQNMAFAAIALVVTIVSTNATFDRQAYYRGLSTIPLQPGRSVFCHQACPALIKRENDIQAQVSRSGLPLKDLLRDPISQELESMKILVGNCRQRQAYIENQRVDSSDESIVEVPEPGVPFNHLGISVHQAHQLTADQS